MPSNKSNFQIIPKRTGPGKSIPAYLIASVGATWAMAQGGVWAAMAVFIAALLVGAAIDSRR